jgi:hypothetical protein
MGIGATETEGSGRVAVGRCEVLELIKRLDHTQDWSLTDHSMYGRSTGVAEDRETSAA